MIHLQKFEAYNCDDDMIMEKLNTGISFPGHIKRRSIESSIFML